MSLAALFLFARRLDDGHSLAKWPVPLQLKHRPVTLKMKCRVLVKGAMYCTRKTKKHENYGIDELIPKATVHVRISAFA